MNTRQGWRVRTTGFIAATMLGSMMLAGVAIADDIVSDVSYDVNAVAKVMALNVGAAGETTLTVVEQNNDGKQGCDFGGRGNPTLSVTASSTDATVATVSPSALTFGSCGDAKTLTVTAVGTGWATISLGQTSNTTGATINLAPATFKVNVTAAAPANGAPSISITGVTDGGEYDKGSVPTAMCEVVDIEDVASSFPAERSGVRGTYSADGIGSQTVSCSYTDAGGLSAESSLKYDIVDPSAPAIGNSLNPTSPDGSNGWYRSDVALTWSVTEAESPSSLLQTGCVDHTILADQVETSYSCSATSAGGRAEELIVSIKRDATDPAVGDGVPSGTLGTNGWYTSPVVVSFTASDATSGLEQATQDVSVSDQGTTVVPSPVFTDMAGNSTSEGARHTAVKVDTGAPYNVQFAAGGPGSVEYYGFVPAQPTCTADDDVSGLASCEVTGYSTAVGSHTLTATATDNAGNTQAIRRDYTVEAWTAKGFFAPIDMGRDISGKQIVNTVKAGSTVPLKFEAFAGTTELTDISAVKSFTYAKATEDTFGTEDAIDNLSTGGTSLRYDWTGGQFIQNWQTPKATAGTTYRVTVTLQDGSTITALVRLK